MEYNEAHARAYAERRKGYSETDQELFRILDTFNVRDKAVLDFGCGDGHHAAEISNMGARQVVGVDISEAMIQRAKANEVPERSISFTLYDGKQIPSPDAGFEIVMSNFVLHNISDTESILKEINRVMKPGGQFVGIFNVCEVRPGHEHLYNTHIPIRLGQEEPPLIVQNLAKSIEEIRVSFKNSGLQIKTVDDLYHPNAQIHDEYEHVDKVVKHVIMIVVEKK